MLCSSGSARAGGELRQPGDHRAGVDHEGHDVDHHDHVVGVGGMGHRRLEGEAEAILAGVGQQVDRVGDRGFRRQLLAQHLGHGGRQGAEVQALERGAVGAEHARDRPNWTGSAPACPAPAGSGRTPWRPAAAGAGFRPGRCRTRRRRRRWRHRRWRRRRYGPTAARPPISVRPPNRAITGLRGRHGARDAAEALMVLDRFDIEQGRADLRPLAQPGEVVLDAEMDGVADRDHRDQRQAARIGLVDELLGERAGLGDEGEAVARRRPRRRAAGRAGRWRRSARPDRDG